MVQWTHSLPPSLTGRLSKHTHTHTHRMMSFAARAVLIGNSTLVRLTAIQYRFVLYAVQSYKQNVFISHANLYPSECHIKIVVSEEEVSTLLWATSAQLTFIVFFQQSTRGVVSAVGESLCAFASALGPIIGAPLFAWSEGIGMSSQLCQWLIHCTRMV